MTSSEPQSMVAILEKASSQLQQKLPFVIYNKPNSKQLIGIFQQNDTLCFVENFEETGFAFAPFDRDKIVLIPKNQSEICIADFEMTSDNETHIHPKEKDRGEAKIKYENLVQKAIDKIESGELSKVVLSREEIVKLSSFDIFVVLKRLFNSYSSAFAYCFFHPKVGLWMGAFSEQLLKMEGAIFYTSAVAGTQLFQESQEAIWENKEKQEQQFVSDFILEKVKKITSSIVISEPYNLKAGNLLHIKTDIQGIVNLGSSLKEVLEILHPTPAVCGLPLDVAKEFILKNEGYDREYYSGFLGELNSDFGTQEKNTDLYVNLRCVKIDLRTNRAHIYVGGGITEGSIPEKEWIETTNKSMTMKEILE